MNNTYNEIYRRIYFDKLFESVVTDTSSGNTMSVLARKTYPMYVEKIGKIVEVDLKTIINSVQSAFGLLSSRYPFMYKFIKWSRPMYVLGDPSDERVIHKTMAVDYSGNLWMNIHFIYNELNCDKEKIFGILFHELMHIFLKHLERISNVISEEDMAALSAVKPLFKNEQLKQNICMDYEVNCDMVADGVVTAEFWNEFGGLFDKKYFGKQWETIYKTDGDSLLKKFLEKKGNKLPDEYFEVIKEIIEALKVYFNPKSTERDKILAKKRLDDLLFRLFGKKDDKLSIRKRLIKLQEHLREIGKIGEKIGVVIEDLVIEPKYMEPEELSKFTNDTNILMDEMLNCVDEISDEFNSSQDILEKDIIDCMETLISGVKKMSESSSLNDDDINEITEEIIYKIDRLLADNIKKKKLDKERREKEKEREEKMKEKMKKKIEELKKTHLLKKYLSKIKDLQAINFHVSEDGIKRLSDKSSNYCEKLIGMIEPLLENETIEKTAEAIKKTGLDNFEKEFKELTKSLHDDLMILKEEKILFDRNEDFINEICDSFENDNIVLFKSYIDGINETELISKIQIAISSIRRIGKELHRQKKVRPSDEYTKAYKEEFEKLRKIYVESGKKGLERELVKE